MNLNLPSIRNWTIIAFSLTGILSGSAQAEAPAKAGEFSAFQVITERNIFDPQRRPVTKNPPPTTTPRKTVDSFSLVGTMSYSNVLLAFFDGTSSEYRKSLEVGGKIATFTAEQITPPGVLLKSDTNETFLKVGWQMRRSDDGTWTASEHTANSYASESSGRTSYNGRRTDNRWSRSRGNENSRYPSESGGQTMNQSDTAAPEMPVAVPGNLDPSDPVARMMLRRMQAEGISPTAGANGANENGAADNQPQPTDAPNFENAPPGEGPGGNPPGISIPSTNIEPPADVPNAPQPER